MDSTSLDYLVSVRRKLHSLAELSGEEYNTSRFIVEELKRLGYKPRLAGTGVLCDVGGGKGRLAFRADIDALPICERTEVTGMGEFAAKGVMHACGHDGHTANLLNLARILGGKSKVPLRLIFQFGEEGIGGSEKMIENGALEGVEEIYALHLCPELDEGKVGYCYGGMFAGCCEFDVCFTGKAAHCAQPEKGADAVKASVLVAQAAYDAAEKLGLLVNLGKVEGGSARNIIASGCRSQYTVRFYDMAKCEQFMLEVERAALRADDTLRTDHRTEASAVYAPLVNHALAVDRVRSIMEGRCVEVPPRYTAEDFSAYIQKVPGCMVWLGTGSEGHRSPLHSDTFSFDERALLVGTELFLGLIESFAG